MTSGSFTESRGRQQNEPNDDNNKRAKQFCASDVAQALASAAILQRGRNATQQGAVALVNPDDWDTLGRTEAEALEMRPAPSGRGRATTTGMPPGFDGTKDDRGSWPIMALLIWNHCDHAVGRLEQFKRDKGKKKGEWVPDPSGPEGTTNEGQDRVEFMRRFELNNSVQVTAEELDAQLKKKNKKLKAKYKGACFRALIDTPDKKKGTRKNQWKFIGNVTWQQGHLADAGVSMTFECRREARVFMAPGGKGSDSSVNYSKGGPGNIK